MARKNYNKPDDTDTDGSDTEVNAGTATDSAEAEVTKGPVVQGPVVQEPAVQAPLTPTGLTTLGVSEEVGQVTDPAHAMALIKGKMTQLHTLIHNVGHFGTLAVSDVEKLMAEISFLVGLVRSKI